jgi:cysteinyl-tRNA synthetase
MKWPSPWGTGFPGWHIECSAMSMKYLGEQLDIHVGGEDLRSTHHPNEIAQSEAATGKQFVKYWVHGTFMNIDGKRMSKSLKNNYTLADLIDKGYKATAVRYLFLTTHYRQTLNFTLEALSGAQSALQNLNDNMQIFKKSERLELTPGKLQRIDQLREKFDSALKDDLNLPQALSVVWETVKSSIPSPDKYDLILSFNEVLGLSFAQESSRIPPEISLLAKKRWELKNLGKFIEADQIRKEVELKGFIINDDTEGYKIKQVR